MATMYCLHFFISSSSINKLSDWLDMNEIYNVAMFEDGSSGLSEILDNNGFRIANKYIIDIYHDNNLFIANLLKQLQYNFNIVEPNIHIVTDLDWEKDYISSLKPIQIGRFNFYNSQYQKEVNECINVKIDSVMAFGTGEHETTGMCIELLSKLETIVIKSNIDNILDMGCGTGILSICASKIFPNSSITAVDIDLNALDVTKTNLASNNVNNANIVHNDEDLSFFQTNMLKFDVILCNILQNPLIAMKNDFIKIANGYIITSGYIKEQEEAILKSYSDFDIIETMYKNQWVAHLFCVK